MLLALNSYAQSPANQNPRIQQQPFQSITNPFSFNNNNDDHPD